MCLFRWCILYHLDLVRVCFFELYSLKDKIMRVFAAFCFVVLLWSTTPLAIKWSTEPGYLFGAASRMVIGLACMLLVLLLSRRKLPLTRVAWLTYLAIAVQIYGAMLAVYWGAQFIPSGWISVIFGLTPLMTALLAAIYRQERSLGFYKLMAYAAGIAGLFVMFGSALEISQNAVRGITAILLAAFIQAASSVWIKRIDAKLPAICQVSGGLLLAVPAYLLTWILIDGHWPENLSPYSLGAIIYLGVIATTIGFALYFYVLTHLPATKVALITLLTPVLSLYLGRIINHEPLTNQVILGSALILLALLLHQLGGIKS